MSQFVERVGESLDFFDGVVVQGSGADDAEGFEVCGFGEWQGVGVAVPDAQSSAGEPFCGFAGGQIGEGPGEGGHAVVESCGIGDAMNLEAGDGAESIEEHVGEAAFVFGEVLEHDIQFLSPGAVGSEGAVWQPVSDAGEVFNGGSGSGDSFMGLSAGHPETWELAGGGAELPGVVCFEQLTASPEDSFVGAEEFVGGAGEEVALEVADGDASVGSIMHCIHKRDGSDLCSLCDHFPDGVDRAGQVGRITDGGEASSFREKILPCGVIECSVVGVDGGMADGCSGLFGCEHPGGDVGVVVELCEEDFIAGSPCFCECVCEVHGEGGHIGAEDHTFGVIGSKKVSERLVGVIEDRIGFASGGKGGAAIAVGEPEIVSNGIGNGIRYLTSGRSIKKGDGASIKCSLQAGEAVTNGFDGPRVNSGTVHERNLGGNGRMGNQPQSFEMRRRISDVSP